MYDIMSEAKMDFHGLRISDHDGSQVEIRRPETLGPGFLSCVYEDWQGKTGGGMSEGGMSECSYLNELPDEFLVEILSRLEVKEAVKTCVVSPRWRNLWTLSTTDETSSSYSRLYYEYASSGAIVVRYRERDSTKDSMILAFDTERDGESVIHDYSRMNDWIQTILIPSAPVLDTSGRLQNARLTALYLDSVYMDGQLFSHCTKLCLNLETLVVVKAPMAFANVGSAVEGIYLFRLKHLEFRYCEDLNYINVWSVPNLESLKLARKEQHVVDIYGELKNLTSLFLEGSFCLNMISKIRRIGPHFQLPRLEQLELNMEDLIREISLARAPLRFLEFSNVKQLKLIFNFSSSLCLMDLALFIKAYPRLQKLTLVYRHQHGANDHNNIHFDEESMKSYTHPHLQVVEFLGWCGHENEVQFANFVIKIASHLHDLVFYPSTPQHQDLGAQTSDQSIPQADTGEKKAIESARRLIRKFKGIKSSRP